MSGRDIYSVDNSVVQVVDDSTDALLQVHLLHSACHQYISVSRTLVGPNHALTQVRKTVKHQKRKVSSLIRLENVLQQDARFVAQLPADTEVSLTAAKQQTACTHSRAPFTGGLAASHT